MEDLDSKNTHTWSLRLLFRFFCAVRASIVWIIGRSSSEKTEPVLPYSVRQASQVGIEEVWATLSNPEYDLLPAYFLIKVLAWNFALQKEVLERVVNGFIDQKETSKTIQDAFFEVFWTPKHNRFWDITGWNWWIATEEERRYKFQNKKSSQISRVGFKDFSNIFDGVLSLRFSNQDSILMLGSTSIFWIRQIIKLLLEWEIRQVIFLPSKNYQDTSKVEIWFLLYAEGGRVLVRDLSRQDFPNQITEGRIYVVDDTIRSGSQALKCLHFLCDSSCSKDRVHFFFPINTGEGIPWEIASRIVR